MKKLLLLLLILTGCATTPDLPKPLTRVAFADTTENGILRIDVDYPVAMFGGNGNKEVTKEINRMIFGDSIDLPLMKLIDRYTTTHHGYAIDLHGRFTEGLDTLVSYVLTDTTKTIISRVFCTIDGHKVTLDEACGGDYTEILFEQLNAHKPDSPAAFTVAPLPLSDNWTVNGFGITFHYSAGEVSPTPASVTIPWSDFR